MIVLKITVSSVSLNVNNDQIFSILYTIKNKKHNLSINGGMVCASFAFDLLLTNIINTNIKTNGIDKDTNLATC